MASLLRMQIMERLSVKTAQFLEPRTEARPGFSRRVKHASFFGLFLLPTRTTEPLSVKEDSFFEPRMAEIPGSLRKVEQPIRWPRFPCPIRIQAGRLVSSA